jgi:hypothetical protein
VALHSGCGTLELLEVFVGQTIEPERAGSVTKFIGHRSLSSSSRVFRVAGIAGKSRSGLMVGQVELGFSIR